MSIATASKLNHLLSASKLNHLLSESLPGGILVGLIVWRVALCIVVL